MPLIRETTDAVEGEDITSSAFEVSRLSGDHHEVCTIELDDWKRYTIFTNRNQRSLSAELESLGEKIRIEHKMAVVSTS